MLVARCNCLGFQASTRLDRRPMPCSLRAVSDILSSSLAITHPQGTPSLRSAIVPPSSRPEPSFCWNACPARAARWLRSTGEQLPERIISIYTFAIRARLPSRALLPRTQRTSCTSFRVRDSPGGSASSDASTLTWPLPVPRFPFRARTRHPSI